MTKLLIRKPYDVRVRQGISKFDVSQTQQQFKEECNINNILKKYHKTGALEHANSRSAEYGFATSNDFRESMEIITNANEMFAELPSKIRTRFANSPENFLDFVQNPENKAEMASMGLIEVKAPDRPVLVEMVRNEPETVSKAEQEPH